MKSPLDYWCRRPIGYLRAVRSSRIARPVRAKNAAPALRRVRGFPAGAAPARHFVGKGRRPSEAIFDRIRQVTPRANKAEACGSLLRRLCWWPPVPSCTGHKHCCTLPRQEREEESVPEAWDEINTDEKLEWLRRSLEQYGQTVLKILSELQELKRSLTAAGSPENKQWPRNIASRPSGGGVEPGKGGHHSWCHGVGSDDFIGPADRRRTQCARPLGQRTRGGAPTSLRMLASLPSGVAESDKLPTTAL